MTTVTPSRATSTLTVLLTLVLLGALIPGAAHAEGSHDRTDAVVTGANGTDIAVTIHRPDGASPEEPAPVILHSHGWGGSRSSGDGAFQRELDRGFGVVSIDQRGFGESGGQAHVQDPELEGRDIIAVIDHVAELDWVARDVDEDGVAIDDDPVLFAMGGSYGGGFQLVAALTEIRDTATYDDDGTVTSPGRTRFNALAPDMTWFDLSRSLAPEGVVRTAWATLLYTVGLPSVAPHIHEGFVYGATTGQWPDGTVPGLADLDGRFFANGPSGFVAEGHRLDIPTLITQGFSDNLFNGNEGWHNFERTLTDDAREDSLFVGYNGGHALPNVLPAGIAGASDGCSPGSGDLRLDFFEAVLAEDGDPRELLGAPYSITTVDDECVQVDSLDATTAIEVGDAQIADRAVTTTGVGVAQHLELMDGPGTIVGVPHLHADVTTLGAEQRVFLGLAVGTSPLDARVVQNNLMPLREPLPVTDEPRTVELPAVAVELEEGESLYLTVTPISDMSFGHGSVRTPGVATLRDMVIDVPLVHDDETDNGDPDEEQPGEDERCRPDNRPDHAPDHGNDCPPGQR